MRTRDMQLVEYRINKKNCELMRTTDEAYAYSKLAELRAAHPNCPYTIQKRSKYLYRGSGYDQFTMWH